MKFFTKSTASATVLLLIALSLLTTAGILGPGSKVQAAEPARVQLVQAVTALSGLRDEIADRWASLVKSGWNAYMDDQPLFADLVEAALAALKATPQDGPLQAERLIIAVAQVPGAEAAYMAAVHNLRGRATECYNGPMAMLGPFVMMMEKADALVLGLPETPPSFEPATLKAAYEAMKAARHIHYQGHSGIFGAILNIMHLLPPSASAYTPQALEPQMEALRRLPNLTERESKAIEKIPEIWAGMDDDIKRAGEALERKQAALADLESQVQAALLAIDDLRAHYLKRLAE